MKKTLLLCCLPLLTLSCKQNNKSQNEVSGNTAVIDSTPTVQTAIGNIELPAPFATRSISKPSTLVLWPKGKRPQVPEGFAVTVFADGLQSPRQTYIGPNGDYFVVESAGGKESADQITLLRDTNNDDKIDEKYVFLNGLNHPYGMLIINNHFYVANVDGLYQYPYKKGTTKITSGGKKVATFPTGEFNYHWTRNIIANKEGNKIYVAIGSATNVGEHGMEQEVRRAAILELNPDGSGEQIYAEGIRNPVGMDWNPITGELWTAVNERDGLGDNLVPDYITSVKKGGWYGWPYSYYGAVNDPRWEEDPHQGMVDKAIVPDVPVGSHTASLGLTFYTAEQFPIKYKNGAFVGQHGSWNRAEFAGYKVLFVPFKDGKPQQPEDFMTGFIADDESAKVYGRPVGVSVTPNGALLVNDDAAGVIWKVESEEEK